MDLPTGLMLAGVGLFGGVANAIAGGATLFTFPAMMWAGLPPIMANASNALAVTPGHAIAGIADREKLPPLRGMFAWSILTTFVGSVVGAILLLVTPERMFSTLVPVLIGAATIIFALAPRIQAAAQRRKIAQGAAAAPAIMGFAAIYGGYFGGGLGVILMAVLGVTTSNELRTNNALKNMLASVVSIGTVAIFVAEDIIAWPETLVMMVGTITGGLLGGRLIRMLPPAVIRTLVLSVGALLAVLYAYREWF